jgi:hypothetical protein
MAAPSIYLVDDMIWRTYSDEDVDRAIEQCKDELKGQPVREWLHDLRNIALRNVRGDVALFEYRQPGVYTGHYFFFSRGKEAVSTSLEVLDEIFSERHDCNMIVGMTPTDKKGALWMSRRVGFTSYGDAEIDGKNHRIFVMTKKDHNE